jgi:hypothetical protein
LDALSVNLQGKRFLDIGPGYGSALDVARERGAASHDFVDYDPFVCTFNRLKGHSGQRLDVRTELCRMDTGRYDFLWLKATFCADMFMAARWYHFHRRYPPLDSILNQVEGLRAHDGMVVFCPYWSNSGGRRHVEDVMETSVVKTLLRHGYWVLPWIEGHNVEPMYPVSFIKSK